MTAVRNAPLLAAVGLWGALWVPPPRLALERNMALHMAVQLPLLAGVGLLLAHALRRHEPRWLAEADWLGIPGLAMVLFATTLWMLPRMLDMAVAEGSADLAKFLSLPLCAGVPLGLSWRRMPALGRAFVFANFIPKLGAVGGLYLAAPVRLCSYYRLDQQAAAGWTLIAVAAGLGMAWFLAAFIGRPALRRPVASGAGGGPGLPPIAAVPR